MEDRHEPHGRKHADPLREGPEMELAVALEIAETVDGLERRAPREEATDREQDERGEVPLDRDEHCTGRHRLHEPEEGRS